MADARRLRRAVRTLCAAVGVGGAAAVAAGFVIAVARIEAPGAASHLLLGGMVAGGAVLGLAVWAFFQLDARLVRPLSAIAHRLELAVSEDASRRERSPPPEPGLAGRVAAVAEGAVAALDAARHDRDAATASATARLEEQRRQLEALIHDLQEGVTVCAADHRVLLCNARAAALLAGTEKLGLGRPLDRVLTPEPLRHGIERLERRRRAGEQYPTTTLVCGVLGSGRSLQCQASLLPEGGETPRGYILSFRDVTAEIAAHAERDRLLRETLETTRRLASGLHTTLDMLVADAAMPEETRRSFERAAAESAARLAETASAHAVRGDRLVAGHWPLADVSSEDIVDSAAPRIAAETGLSVRAEGEPAWLRSDGSSLVELVSALAAGIAAAAHPAELAIRAMAAPDAGRAYLDLCWSGEVLPMARLEAVLEAPLSGNDGPTGHEILERHGGEVWPDRTEEGRARLRLALRQARAPEPLPTSERPEFYDFEIAASPAVLSDERRLASLAHVVFDTETTGLDPSGGDRIVQIAGVRIANGRMLASEVFDCLVQPDRPISAQSTGVHGITNEMVADAPSAAQALRRFHGFAADAVLVAHNAAFDMAFLRRAEAAAGVSFDNPVLDTVLLSAFLEPDSPAHTLDALGARYGITFEPGTRHTALGDARATARLFLAMLPLLASRGVLTLGQAVRASEGAAAIRRKQQRY